MAPVAAAHGFDSATSGQFGPSMVCAGEDCFVGAGAQGMCEYGSPSVVSKSASHSGSRIGSGAGAGVGVGASAIDGSVGSCARPDVAERREEVVLYRVSVMAGDTVAHPFPRGDRVPSPA